MTHLLIPLLAQGLGLALRFLTGAFLADVYPMGMKVMSTWTKADRGLGIGLLVGALTVGSAAPHLLKALAGVDAWQLVLYLAGATPSSSWSPDPSPASGPWPGCDGYRRPPGWPTAVARISKSAS
jgi:hypothetical protein